MVGGFRRTVLDGRCATASRRRHLVVTQAHRRSIGELKIQSRQLLRRVPLVVRYILLERQHRSSQWLPVDGSNPAIGAVTPVLQELRLGTIVHRREAWPLIDILSIPCADAHL